MNHIKAYEIFGWFKPKSKAKSISKPEEILDIKPSEKLAKNYKPNYKLVVSKDVNDLLIIKNDDTREKIGQSSECMDFLRTLCIFDATKHYSYKDEYPDGEILGGAHNVLFTYHYGSSQEIGNVYTQATWDFKSSYSTSVIDILKEKEQLINLAKINGIEAGKKVIIENGKFSKYSGSIIKVEVAITSLGQSTDRRESIITMELLAEVTFDEPFPTVGYGEKTAVKSCWKKVENLKPFTEQAVSALSIQLDELEDFFLALIEEYQGEVDITLSKSFDKISNYHSVVFKFKEKPKLDDLTKIVDQIKRINMIFSKKGYKIELNEINRFEIKIYIRPI